MQVLLNFSDVPKNDVCVSLSSKAYCIELSYFNSISFSCTLGSFIQNISVHTTCLCVGLINHSMFLLFIPWVCFFTNKGVKTYFDGWQSNKYIIWYQRTSNMLIVRGSKHILFFKVPHLIDIFLSSFLLLHSLTNLFLVIWRLLFFIPQVSVLKIALSCIP